MTAGASLPTVAEIQRRLKLIFPEQVDPSGWVRRELAAKTVFVMLYGGAVESADRWVRPTAVTDMTDAQAALIGLATRHAWLDLVQGPLRPREVPGRWFGENTREPIRDETLRTLVRLGAVVERPGLPTTSSKPRYAMAADFADLFEAGEEQVEAAVDAWQQRRLSPAARARIALLRKGTGGDDGGVLVLLPSGETRRLAPGPSSLLIKGVVEEFAPRFLCKPAVVFLSESAQKMTYMDEDLSRAIGFNFHVSGVLPDILLVDLEADPPLLVFVECVVSEGIIDERRHAELQALASEAGYHKSDCAYVTAFRDRAASLFSRKAAALAWGSFVWFETEPDHIVFFRGSGERTSLAQLLRNRSA